MSRRSPGARKSPGKRKPSTDLTKGQEAFAQAYASNGGNGAKAYASAFPKSRKSTAQVRAVNASKLKAKPKIRERIACLQAVTRKVATDRYAVTADRVIGELARIAFSNMLDYVEPTEEGAVNFRLTEMDRDTAAAVSEVTIEEFTDGRGEDARPVRRTKFKLHDKKGALVDLGKNLGLFKAQVEVTGKDGNPVEVSAVPDANDARRVALWLTQAAAAVGK